MKRGKPVKRSVRKDIALQGYWRGPVRSYWRPAVPFARPGPEIHRFTQEQVEMFVLPRAGFPRRRPFWSVDKCIYRSLEAVYPGTVVRRGALLVEEGRYVRPETGSGVFVPGAVA